MSTSEGELLLAVGPRGDELPGAAVDAVTSGAKAGDPDSFRQLMEWHETQVFRTGLRLLGNREDALDATQEVFLRLFRFQGKLDPRRPIAPWLYTMTLNVCRDLAKKRSRWATTRPDRAVAVQNGAVRQMDAEIEAQIVEEGLQMLTERERAAVVLRDIEGLSTRDVALAMRIREFTVRSLISRGRVKLRRYRDERLGKDHAL